MLERYLDELRRELAAHLPEDDLPSRLAEAEAHLREGIEGRVELGLSPEEAVRETIEAFGATRTLARAAAPKHSPSPRATILAAGYGLGVLFLLFPMPIRNHRWGIAAIFGLWIVLGLAFAVMAFRARRPAPIPLALTGLIGSLAVWSASGLWIAVAPGHLVHPLEMPAFARSYEEVIETRTTARRTFDEALDGVRGPRGIETQRVQGRYIGPIERSVWGPEERLEYGFYDDARHARRSWENADRKARKTFDTQYYQRALDQAREARWRPLATLAESKPSILPPNLAVAGFVVVLDFVASVLGVAFASIRRRRGGLRA